MKKILLTIMLCIAGVIGAAAQHSNVGRHILVVNTVSGEPVEFAFQTDPVATIEGKDVVITDINDDRVLFPVTDLVNITFKIDPKFDSVETLESDGTAVRFTLTRTEVSVSGLEPGAQVTLYSLDGAKIVAAKAAADGTLTISTQSLPKGVYTVVAPKHSFKFIK